MTCYHRHWAALRVDLDRSSRSRKQVGTGHFTNVLRWGWGEFLFLILKLTPPFSPGHPGIEAFHLPCSPCSPAALFAQSYLVEGSGTYPRQKGRGNQEGDVCNQVCLTFLRVLINQY